MSIQFRSLLFPILGSFTISMIFIMGLSAFPLRSSELYGLSESLHCFGVFLSETMDYSFGSIQFDRLRCYGYEMVELIGICRFGQGPVS